MKRPKLKSRHTPKFEIPLMADGSPLTPQFVRRDPARTGSGQMLAQRLRPRENPFESPRRLDEAAMVLSTALGQSDKDYGVVLADIREMVLAGHVRQFGWSDRESKWVPGMIRVMGSYSRGSDGIHRLVSESGQPITDRGGLVVMPEHLDQTGMGVLLADVLTVWGQRGVQGLEEACEMLGIPAPTTDGTSSERLPTAGLRAQLGGSISNLDSAIQNKKRYPALVAAYDEGSRTWDVALVTRWAMDNGKWSGPKARKPRTAFDL
jgi:hypothetical protein